ncbi:hypothetical protein IW262DRAFT_1299669 [Armillaria fumosa]|nr:hypothetical protein IW262DRAFT_1299669 [Armillaria fumosa]
MARTRLCAVFALIVNGCHRQEPVLRRNTISGNGRARKSPSTLDLKVGMVPDAVAEHEGHPSHTQQHWPTLSERPGFLGGHRRVVQRNIKVHPKLPYNIEDVPVMCEGIISVPINAIVTSRVRHDGGKEDDCARDSRYPFVKNEKNDVERTRPHLQGYESEEGGCNALGHMDRTKEELT